MSGLAPQLLPWSTSSLLVGWLLVLLVQRINAQRGWTDRNYAGRVIPTSVGLAFGLTSAVMIPQALLWRCLGGCGPEASSESRVAALFTIGLAGFTVLGLLDDRYGTHEIRGLRGHFGALRRGVVTTGAIKALGGAMLAVVLAGLLLQERRMSIPSRWALALVDGALIALAANAVNLLDRRPARALKAYWLGLAVIVLAGGQAQGWLMVPLSAATLAFALSDFRAQAMMGDAGSNTLGAALGLMVVIGLPPWVRGVGMVLLLTFNLGSERCSYSRLIEAHPLLRWLDQLGTRPRVP